MKEKNFIEIDKKEFNKIKISAILSKETARQLKELCEKYGENKTKLIVRAITLLYHSETPIELNDVINRLELKINNIIESYKDKK